MGCISRLSEGDTRSPTGSAKCVDEAGGNIERYLLLSTLDNQQILNLQRGGERRWGSGVGVFGEFVPTRVRDFRGAPRLCIAWNLRIGVAPRLPLGVCCRSAARSAFIEPSAV
ncbi:MAG: hypothetical protein QW680_03890 [Pyrobaculum sp.]